jgi:hypothetical protein
MMASIAARAKDLDERRRSNAVTGSPDNEPFERPFSGGPLPDSSEFTRISTPKRSTPVPRPQVAAPSTGDRPVQGAA